MFDIQMTNVKWSEVKLFKFQLDQSQDIVTGNAYVCS